MAGKLKGSSTACGVDVDSLRLYMILKKRGFKFNGQSYLFWEYIRALRTINPDYFMLENVRVTKKWLPMFNEAMGVEPLRINSSLVSAQNRDRYYWHNLGEIAQPDDERKHLVIRDILEDNVSDALCGASRGRYIVDGKRQDGKMLTAGLTEQMLEVRPDGKTNCLTTVQKDNLVVFNTGPSIRMPLKDVKCIDKIKNVNPSGNGMNGNVYGVDAKSPTVTTNKGEGSKISSDAGATYRKFTPLECERLQTLPDNYTEGVSNSQRYKMIGNGWTIDVVAHILRHIPIEDTVAEKGLFDE